MYAYMDMYIKFPYSYALTISYIFYMPTGTVPLLLLWPRLAGGLDANALMRTNEEPSSTPSSGGKG